MLFGAGVASRCGICVWFCVSKESLVQDSYGLIQSAFSLGMGNATPGLANRACPGFIDRSLDSGGEVLQYGTGASAAVLLQALLSHFVLGV